MEKFKEYKREFTDEEMVLHAWDKEMIQNTVSRFVNYWGNGDTAEAIDELWVKEPEHTADASFGTNTGFGGANKADCHIDGVIRDPTLYLDDRLILNRGVFVI